VNKGTTEQVPGFQKLERSSYCRIRFLNMFPNIAPGHGGNDRSPIMETTRFIVNHSSIPKYHNTIRQALDLFETMTDIDDPNPLGGEFPHDAKKVFAFTRAKCGGWFIKN
jgi:hypothetical protein